MGRIDREDMLELTRRMTLKRNCFTRLAGAYMDGDGYTDGTFNTDFLKLSSVDQSTHMKNAKEVIFSGTNTELKEYCFKKEDMRAGGVWQLLMGINGCGLKNDALLDVFYEMIGERYQPGRDYGIYLFSGSYDIPVKAKDKERLGESEEVYQFLIGAICPVDKDYEPGKPMCGFLFPAFSDRSSDTGKIDLFVRDGGESFLQELILGGKA